MKVIFLIPVFGFLFFQQPQPKNFTYKVNSKDTVFIFTNQWHKCSWKKCLFTTPMPLSYFHSDYEKMNEFEYDNYFRQKAHFDHPDWDVNKIEKELSNFKYCKI